MKTETNHGKKLDDIKSIYNNTFTITGGTIRGSTLFGKDPKKNIK